MPIYKQVLILALYLGIGSLLHAAQVGDAFDAESTLSWGALLGWPFVILTWAMSWLLWFLRWAVVLLAGLCALGVLYGICRGLWELAKVKLELRRQQRQADEDYKFGRYDLND